MATGMDIVEIGRMIDAKDNDMPEFKRQHVGLGNVTRQAGVL